MRRNTPAVTSVEEWTSAETGVGAAMAAGNQLENGIWALLVIAATEMVKIIRYEYCEGHIVVIFQWPWLRDHAMAKRIITSPMRLVRAVIIPAAKDFGFW